MKQVYIPNSNFNITTYNNRIPFFESGVDKVAVLPPGFYTQPDLMSGIAASMTAASGGAIFTVTESALPHRLIITSTVAFQLKFGSDKLNTASEIIGFVNTDTALNTVQTANNVSNLANLRSYNIILHGASSAFRDITGRNYTFCVPITDNSFGITVYEPSVHFPQSVHFNSIVQTLEISLVDEKGNIIQTSTDWHMVIEFCGNY